MNGNRDGPGNPHADDTPAGMDRATGIDDPVSRDEYGDDPADIRPDVDPREDPNASLDVLVPDDFRERQQEAYGSTDDADLFVTDIPVCLNCRSANVGAYGGGKQTLTVDGYELVADDCHQCEQATVQVLGEA